ncbi:MAG: RNA polymerase sigma-70 factor [Bacteroidetes bacterium]|nr:RNA polymerase sigma-70 factor [Bacteroidota bacterium]
MELSDRHIISQITQSDESAFEKLFRSFYSLLCGYANKFLNDTDESEEIVQELFCNLWIKREELNVTSSLRSYLFRAVRNSCLNRIKHYGIRDDYKETHLSSIKAEEISGADLMEANELENRIRHAIDRLPLERRKVFIMSRYDGLKYREIAEKLKISVKTVENQMGAALRFLRGELADYLPFLIFLMLYELIFYCS